MKYLDFDRATLIKCTIEIFKRLKFIETFNIDVNKLKNLLTTIALRYKLVPYHHFTHAFNLVHFLYYIFKTVDMTPYLDDIDLLAIILAALSHDLNHPGANNGYL